MQHALNAVQTQTLKPPAAVLQVAPAMLASQETAGHATALIALEPAMTTQAVSAPAMQLAFVPATLDLPVTGSHVTRLFALTTAGTGTVTLRMDCVPCSKAVCLRR